MTANGTTPTTEEATAYVCDLDMFGRVQLLKESPVKYADARKLRERHAEEILTFGRTNILIAEIFGDMITSDHNVLYEDQESRMHHTHAVLVQDLATQRVQSYSSKTKSAQEKRKFFHPEENPRSFFTMWRCPNRRDFQTPKCFNVLC